MQCGTSFLMPAPGGSATPHLWIIITDPDPQCVIVSLSTLRHAKDQTVILRPGDHPFVQHDTMVFYLDARIVDVNVLQALVDDRSAVLHADCPASTLKLIQSGAHASDFTPRKVAQFCREKLRKASGPV